MTEITCNSSHDCELNYGMCRDYVAAVCSGGPWAGVGMAVDSRVVEQLEAQGMGAVREE